MGMRSDFSWLLRSGAATAALLAATSAFAADLPTQKTPPASAPVIGKVTPSFFVKAGFLYAINQSSSKLYSQDLLSGGFGPQSQLPGVGATVGNVATLGLEAGYYVTPNVSIDISAGIPMWASDKTKGAPPVAPPTYGNPPSGTTLAKIMPSFIPLTALYHFNQFGAFQPYLGAGVAAVFSFQTKDEFNTGVTVDPTVGFVVQGGADIMIDQHWGWTFDVKKLFANATSHATGDVGVPFALASTQKTFFQPWVLSTGVAYRW